MPKGAFLFLYHAGRCIACSEISILRSKKKGTRGIADETFLFKKKFTGKEVRNYEDNRDKNRSLLRTPLKVPLKQRSGQSMK